MLENGATQKNIAKTLNVTQGYVSMIKAKAQYNYDYAEQTTAIKTNCPEYLWKCWNLFTKKLEMPMFFISSTRRLARSKVTNCSPAGTPTLRIRFRRMGSIPIWESLRAYSSGSRSITTTTRTEIVPRSACL